MTEAFETAVDLARQLAVRVVETVHDIAPPLAFAADVEVFHRHEFGNGETVVHFGEAHLFARIGNARLGVGVAGGRNDFGKSSEIIILRKRTLRGPGDK